MEYFSAVALEDLENGSLAIKTENGVRKIKTYQDLRENLVVFIYNVRPSFIANYDEVDNSEIPKGRAVRCVKVSIG